MDNEKENPKVQEVQADNNSIAIGEINISGMVTGDIRIGHTITPLPPAETRLRHDLGILLKNVEMTWIKGVLEKSVHDAALLELGMELREEAVDNPWRMVMEKPDQSREEIPQGRKIKDIFDEANRLLLILGEPGSGKTTTLLQLTRDLIAEVDETFTQPVPVILNLSTWTNKQQSLDEWMVAELSNKYRLPKKDGKKWLSERRILPLLDGLDEVKSENRAACVEKINQLVNDYGLQGLVICSRIKDYTDLNVRLAFYRAIYLQPLTPELVNEYLNKAGDKLTSLRETLQGDEALQEMAQSPLILNIMSLAYQNTSAEALSDPILVTNEARRKHLLDSYIERMFNRRVDERTYNHEQTKQHLAWLARNMQRNNQDVFLIEGLQPSWLALRRSQRTYILFSRMLSGLTVGLIFESVKGLSYIIGGLYAGLIIGLSVGFIDLLRFERSRKQTKERESNVFWRSATNLMNIVMVWLIVILVSVLASELIVGLYSLYYGAIYGLVDGLLAGLANGLSVGPSIGSIPGFIFGLRNTRTLENDIQAVETLRWSWHKARIGLISGGLIVALICGLPFGLLGGLTGGLLDRLIGVLIMVLTFGLIFGLMGGLIAAIFNGLSREIIETKSFPNQGIRLSLISAISGGLRIGVIGMIGGLIFMLGDWQFDGLVYELGDWLIGGLRGWLAGAFLGALWYGGLDVIQHYTLRLILIFQGHTPRNYVRFLDYAVDHIFLQKVGGGYRFIHRMLLEHFAEMYEEKV